MLMGKGFLRGILIDTRLGERGVPGGRQEIGHFNFHYVPDGHA